MSLPAPLTVNTPLLKPDDPLMPTAPTSWLTHGLGSVAVAAVVNAQTGPVVVPTLLCPTICQKYGVREAAERSAGAADRRPGRPVGRRGSRDGRSRADQPEPDRRGLRRTSQPRPGAAVARAGHELDAAARCHVEDHVCGGRRQRAAEHYARVGGDVCVLQRRDARGDLFLAAHRLLSRIG